MPSETPDGPLAPSPEVALDEATRILREIARLCHDHRSALATHDTDVLTSLVERAETLGARFRLLESSRKRLAPEGRVASAALVAARGRLAEAAAEAALAAQSSADLLARSSAASAALRRVLDGFAGAGYLPNGEVRPASGASFLETKA